MLIATLGWDPEEQIPVSEDGDTLTLSDALTRHFEITKLTKPLLQQAAAIFDNDDLSDKVQDNEWVQQYINGRDFIDLLNDFGTDELLPVNLSQLYVSCHQENIPSQVAIKQRRMKYILR